MARTSINPSMGKRNKRTRRPSQAQLERWRRRREEKAKKLLDEAEEKEPEVLDGKVYRVMSLPEKRPPKRRSARTRFHFKDVEKEGDV